MVIVKDKSIEIAYIRGVSKYSASLSLSKYILLGLVLIILATAQKFYMKLLS